MVTGLPSRFTSSVPAEDDVTLFEASCRLGRTDVMLVVGMSSVVI